MAHLEGADDVSQISPISRFVAGGIGGVVSQFVFLEACISPYLIWSIGFRYIPLIL